MRIVLNDGYFGGSDCLKRFAERAIDEIKKIDDIGRKHSTAPDNYLGDCYPSLNSLLLIFEQFLTKCDEAEGKVELVLGESKADIIVLEPPKEAK
jgi:hypothetical protein